MLRREFIKSIGIVSGLSFTHTDSWEGGEKTDVLVLGAGLSGLATALALQERGYRVIVLEGSHRTGGRLMNLNDLPGKPNAGGTEVGDGYKRLVAMAEKLKVELITPTQERGATVLGINGNIIKDTEWPNSPHNLLLDNEKKILPNLLEFTLMRDRQVLKNLDDWYKPEFAQYDISFFDFLKQNGASSEALRLINANANTNNIATTSTLNILRSNLIRTKGGSTKTLRIRGGSECLPEAMAAALKGQVLHQKIVKKIKLNPQRITVICGDGTEFKAKFCVCTLPFTALRNVRITPSLLGVQAEAVQHLPYTQITQVHVVPKGNFWEDDGLPLSMWTDGMLGRLFFEKASDGITSYRFWLNGAEAIAADKLGEKATAELILKEMAKLRPQSAGKLEVLRVISWGNNPFYGGAYSHFAPKQVSRFAQSMAQPMERLFFAGEHTATIASGMEGAFESAERVVAELLQHS